MWSNARQFLRGVANLSHVFKINKMATLYSYFERKEEVLPDVEGPLSAKMPKRFIESANAEVEGVLKTTEGARNTKRVRGTRLKSIMLMFLGIIPFSNSHNLSLLCSYGTPIMLDFMLIQSAWPSMFYT